MATMKHNNKQVELSCPVCRAKIIEKIPQQRKVLSRSTETVFFDEGYTAFHCRRCKSWFAIKGKVKIDFD